MPGHDVSNVLGGYVNHATDVYCCHERRIIIAFFFQQYIDGIADPEHDRGELAELEENQESQKDALQRVALLLMLCTIGPFSSFVEPVQALSEQEEQNTLDHEIGAVANQIARDEAQQYLKLFCVSSITLFQSIVDYICSDLCDTSGDEEETETDFDVLELRFESLIPLFDLIVEALRITLEDDIFASNAKVEVARVVVVFDEMPREDVDAYFSRKVQGV